MTVRKFDDGSLNIEDLTERECRIIAMALTRDTEIFGKEAQQALSQMYKNSCLSYSSESDNLASTIWNVIGFRPIEKGEK